MELTNEFISQYKKLDTSQKAFLLQMCADEFMSPQECSDCLGMAKRTVYDKLEDKPQNKNKNNIINGFDFCGHKIIYFEHVGQQMPLDKADKLRKPILIKIKDKYF